MLMYNNNISSLANVYTSDTFWPALSKQLKLIKDCGTATNQGCFAPVAYKCINQAACSDTDIGLTSSYPNPYGTINLYRGILANGTHIMTNYFNPACTNGDTPSDPTICGHIYIDVNGTKGPNQLGRDTFLFHIMANGKIVPFGILQDSWSGCDPASTDISPDPTTGAPGLGYGCTGKIVLENAINY